ncbi:hypothetical protein Y1Q_0009664 [Alligator mississippiensis]|uniref:Uncharacterized protein n=1 Tax=Alligator mississippiensis TaxID=8496 RepID=A0A151NDC9_ALLMI|nr:hypothetical protein Y1Q_0009664 [Alligator mississippiensis]
MCAAGVSTAPFSDLRLQLCAWDLRTKADFRLTPLAQRSWQHSADIFQVQLILPLPFDNIIVLLITPQQLQ